MKKIYLGKSTKYTMVDDADYMFLKQFSWYLSTSGYAVTNKHIPALNKSLTVRMHRVLMLLSSTSSQASGLIVDHINDDKLDNRKANLRICTKSLNEANKVRDDNKTGYRGVYVFGDKYGASIAKDRKSHYLGLYNTAIEAAQAYNKKATELHGEFAQLNKIIADVKERA